MKQMVKIKQMLSTSKAKEVFYKLISLDEVEEVSLDVSSQQVTMEVVRPIPMGTLQQALVPISVD